MPHRLPGRGRRTDGMKGLHTGHRHRMKQRFLRFGADVFETHQLLEMLLYYSVPYRDTNPTARRLMLQFGSPRAILSAPREQLMTVCGVGERTARMLRAIGRLDRIGTAEGDCTAPAPLSLREACDHLVAMLACETEPAIAAVAQDNAGCYLGSELLYRLDYHSGGVRADAFIRFAVECGASAIVIGHSRPRGPLFPLEGDRETYKMLRAALMPLGIAVTADLLVIGDECLRTDTGRREPYVATVPGGRLITDIPARDGGMRALLTALLEPIRGQLSAARTARAIVQLGTRERIYAADVAALAALPDVTLADATYLRLALAFYLRQLTDRFHPGVRLSENELIDVLGAMLLGTSVETVLVAARDGRDRVTCIECVSAGAINFSPITARRLLDVTGGSAERLILAHSHPGGTPEPSAQDLSATRALSEALTAAGVRLTAHYVYAGTHYCDALSAEADVREISLTGEPETVQTEKK